MPVALPAYYYYAGAGEDDDDDDDYDDDYYHYCYGRGGSPEHLGEACA